MNMQLRNRLLTGFALAVMMYVTIAPTAIAAEQSIVGMWEITGTPDAGSGVPPFVNISQISRDGHMVNVDPTEGASIGEWQRATGNSYAVTFHGFLPLGPEIAQFVVNGDLQLGADHDSLSGTFVTEVTLNGIPVFSFSGLISGSRL